MDPKDEKIINLQLQGISAEIKALTDLNQSQLNAILDQTTKTNGRVSKLEEEVDELKRIQNQCQMPLVHKQIELLERETAASRVFWANKKLSWWALVGIFLGITAFISALVGGILKIFNQI